jgi:nickel-dependent lactate racemase
MKRKKETSKKSYVCGIDWQHEIGECNDVKLYSSIKALKKARQCWEECGIVELEIKVKKWVEPQDLYKSIKNIKKENKDA